MAELRYLTLSASDDGLAERGGARRLVFVPRADITRLELAHGVTAERPLLGSLFGAALLLLLAWPLLEVVGALAGWRDGRVFGGSILAGALGGVLGGALLRASLQKRLHLVVHTARDQRKLRLDGPLDLESLEFFLGELERRWQYPVQRRLSERQLYDLRIPLRPPP